MRNKISLLLFASFFIHTLAIASPPDVTPVPKIGYGDVLVMLPEERSQIGWPKVPPQNIDKFSDIVASCNYDFEHFYFPQFCSENHVNPSDAKLELDSIVKHPTKHLYYFRFHIDSKYMHDGWLTYVVNLDTGSIIYCTH